MKTKKNSPFHRVSTAAFAALTLALSTSAQAQSLTWVGGNTTNGSWNAVGNLSGGTLGAGGNTVDLTFDNLTRATANDIGGSRTVRSISFGDVIDSTWTTNMTSAAVLTFSALSGNASLNVNAGSIGNITFNGGAGLTGSQSLTSNLEINHNGSGLLLWNRQTAGAGGFIKNGNGTFIIAAPNNNSFTGAVQVNAGRMVMASTSSASGDFNTSSGITLNGGILEIRTTNALNKSVSQNLTVSSASTFAYNNTAATDQSLTLGTGTMALNGNLTVQNISSSAAGNNVINITRNLTGNSSLIVDTYNNVASGAVSFSNGRVQLSGDNTAWNGNLVVAKGTAQYSGTNALGGTGSITLGTTGDAFGAALGFNTGSTSQTLSKAITVTTGGIRLIRNNSGPGSTANLTLSGPITLDGSLTLDHAGLGAGKSITVSGNATGAGGLNVTFEGPHPDADSSVRLSGTNSYTGATNVGSGKLIIDASGTINSTSGVSIGAGEFRYNSSTALSQAVAFSSTGGTLSGTGTITPSVDITTGNSLAVGDGGIGATSFGGALTIGGTYLYELNGGTNSADLGDVTGNLALGGILDLVQLGTYTVGDRYTLFAYDGILSGTLSGLANNDTFLDDLANTWQIRYDDTSAGLNGGVSANNTYVTITAVPEPNVAALLGGLGSLALLLRRRA